MFLADILSWWYGKGFLSQIYISINRLKYLVDYFSLRILISTLFSPYKQMASSNVDGSFEDKMRAFFDKQISRFVGASVRTFIIFVGLTALSLQLLLRTVVMLFWILAPIVPVIALILVVIGWTP